MKKSHLLAAAAAAALAAAAEAAARKRDEQAFPAPGRFVEVDGKRMHLLEIGAGPQTIVLLPGLGTIAPCVDFRDLAEELHGFRCVIPEPLGYGWSDTTSAPRTVQRIVEELRAGLSSAGLRPPYLLLGHSVAGFYIRWWACRYPDEVSGLINIDNSVPEQIDQPELSRMLPDHGLPRLILKGLDALAPFGASRAAMYLTEEASSLCANRPEALPAVRARGARMWSSKPIQNEYRAIRENAAAAAAAFPSCPILVFAANGEKSAGSLTFRSGFSWVRAHEAYAARAVRGKCVVLPGPHYLHHPFYREIAREIEAFYGAPNG